MENKGNMSRMVADRITAVVLILVALGLWAQTGDLQYNGKVFPILLAMLLIVLSSIQFVQSYLKKGPRPGKSGEIEETREDWKYIFFALPLIFAWIFLLDVLGFVVTSVIFLTILTVILDLRRPTWRRTFSIVLIYTTVAFVFWLTFHKLLLVPLPTGYFI
jgi:hypothetical protein